MVEPSPSELSEVERLREENARLRAEVDSASAGRTVVSSAKRRAVVSVALIVLGALLLPAAAFTVWTRNQILDTDRYVATMTPLGSDPAVVDALADRLADSISAQIDIKQRAEEALPERATFLAGPIASGADSLIHRVALELVQSETFRRLWVTANREAHAGLVAVLTGRDGALASTKDGKVVVSLGAVATEVAKEIDTSFGIELAGKIPIDKLDVDFVVVDSKELAGLQSQVRLLDRLSWLTVILAIVCFAGGVAVAPDRRRATLRTGTAVVVSTVLTLVALQLAREFYLTHLPEQVERPAVAAIVFDTLTRFLLQAVRVLLALGVVIFFGAWVAGPSRAATRVRSWWDALLGRGSAGVGDNVGLGPVPAWVERHVVGLRAAIAVLGAATVVMWDRPTAKVVLLIAVLCVIPLAVVQLLAGIAARRDASAVGSERPRDVERSA